jgi:hypothetical protein
MNIEKLKARAQVFATLARGNKPVIVTVEGFSDDNPNVIVITISSKNGLFTGTREINVDTNKDITFFDAALDSKYYYQLIEHANNSYDAISVHELDTFMDVDIALAEAQLRERESGNEHLVAIRKL